MRISDWSSDVCSSDLDLVEQATLVGLSSRLEELLGRDRHPVVLAIGVVGVAQSLPLLGDHVRRSSTGSVGVPLHTPFLQLSLSILSDRRHNDDVVRVQLYAFFHSSSIFLSP